MVEDDLQEILRSADKHPSSRVSQLIRIVQTDPSQKSVVLLLIELAEHSEFSVDFGISLKYYLNLFEHMCRHEELIFNEAGLLLVNSCKIYARRVDFVHTLVESQILSLSKSENDNENKNKNANKDKNENVLNNENNSEIIHRKGRKRNTILSINDPYEIELVSKRFRTITAEKRFSVIKDQQMTTLHEFDFDDYIHPTSWLHGTIYDLENDDELDSKRNYKLFTHHVEHRYNTLVPDINFRLHFKVKDFLDEEEHSSSKQLNITKDRIWPTLSEAYIEQYINLENHVLNQELVNSVQNHDQSLTTENIVNSDINIISDILICPADMNKNHDFSIFSDSGIYSINSTLESTNTNTIFNGSLNETNLNAFGENKGISVASELPNISDVHASNNADEKSTNVLDKQLHDNYSTNVESMIEDNSQFHGTNSKIQYSSSNNSEIDLTMIRVHLPHLDDEGVYFSDLGENDQIMLSPRVIATDVLPGVLNKRNLTITLNDKMKKFLNINDKERSINNPKIHSMKHNIFNLPMKVVNRQLLFKLGPEFKLYMDTRLNKNLRLKNEIRHREFKNVNNNFDKIIREIRSLASKWKEDFYNIKDDDIDFLGFSETECDQISVSNVHRISRDSGFDVDVSSQDYGFIDSSILNNDDETIKSICEDNLCNSNKVTDITNKENTSSIETINDTNILSKEDHMINSCGVQATNSDVNDEVINDAVSRNENIDMETDNIITAEDEMDNMYAQESLKTRTQIQQWHDQLRPILNNSRERHHFDVFNLGTEIIDAIQTKSAHTSKRMIENQSNDRQMASFLDVMENKDKSNVSRYFLSALLLVNQGNLVFNLPTTNGEQPIEWCNVTLELHNTTRHNVALEDNVGQLDNNSKVLSHAIQIENNLLQTKRKRSNDNSDIFYTKKRLLQKEYHETNMNGILASKQQRKQQSNISKNNLVETGIIHIKPMKKKICPESHSFKQSETINDLYSCDKNSTTTMTNINGSTNSVNSDQRLNIFNQPLL